MKFIGNFNSWIDPSWEHLILTRKGQARPRDWLAINSVENVEYTRALDAGYQLNAIHWWVYEKQDVSFDICPPFVKGEYHWWITKLYPGQYMPMHTDPHTYERPCIRYWCPLQDYCSGHIFIINDEMIKNYKKGDVWVYDTEHDVHGAANIGHIPRIVLQITEYS